MECAMVSFSGGGGLKFWLENYSTATQTNVSFTPKVADANVSVVLQPKGTGAILAQIPTGTTVGGNARGQYAVDLQLSRNNANQVASSYASVIVGGTNNRAAGSGYAVFVGGGDSNSSTGTLSAIVGGILNNCQAPYSFIGGGYANTIGSVGDFTTIAGGGFNTASNRSTIAGGSGITANGQDTFVGGGQNHTASGQNSTIGGGLQNTVSNTYATIGGGQTNTVSGQWAVIGGGLQNTASGQYSIVAGGYSNQATALEASILGGISNRALGSDSVVVGGKENQAQAGNDAVVGGFRNVISSGGGGNEGNSFIGGGDNNRILPLQNQNSAIVGGSANTINGFSAYAFLGGGQSNVNGGNWATLAGGRSNNISANYSFIGGGFTNSVSGTYSSILGGLQGSAYLYGQQSYASGRFSTTGDAQAHELIWRREITGTAQTELFLDGASIAAILPGTNAIWHGTIDIASICTVVGNGTTTLGDVTATSYKVTIKRIGTATTLVGTVQEIGTTNQDNAIGSTFLIDNNNTNESLRIQCTPPTSAGSTTVHRVVATFRGLQIQY